MVLGASCRFRLNPMVCPKTARNPFLVAVATAANRCSCPRLQRYKRSELALNDVEELWPKAGTRVARASLEETHFLSP